MSTSHRAHKRALILLALAAVLAASLPGQAAPKPSVASKLDAALTQHVAKNEASIPVVIQFASRPNAADARALREAGFTGPMIRYEVLPAVAASGSASAIRAALRNDRVTRVSFDAVVPYTLDRATTVGRARQTWGAEYTDIDGVHTDGITGRGVGIAIVDTGIDATHPDLRWKPLAEAAGEKPKTIANYKMLGRDSAGIAAIADADGFLQANMLAVDTAHTDNTGGHGTHCAGIAAGTGAASGGKYKGAAPGANLIGFGAGETLVISLGLAAFDYIHLHHDELNIRVVSNSWGGPGDWDPESPVTIAARQLVTDGLVVLFAAGNNGGDGSTIQSSVWANIDDPGIISVANYYDRTGWLGGSSSRGLKSLERTWPDLAAPGTEIISTSATAGPVSYFGTAQDAAINHLEGYGEPDVVTAPAAATPVTVEQNVGGQDVVVGPYASFTGTSMAAPFVAGVSALMLEANSALTPQQVRIILRETANMLPNRSYETDGYAVGKGVVDAAEAVAVALRMKAGDPLNAALANAHVDSSGSVYKINAETPRRLAIDAPLSGATVSGASVTVDGKYFAGPVTDNTVPLLPPPPPTPTPSITGNMVMFHEVAGAGVNPLGPAGTTVAASGESIRLGVLGITSNTFALTKDNFTASHVVKKDGATAFGPFAATITPDGSALQSRYSWVVPSDAESGDYVYEAYATWSATGDVFKMGSMPFTIVGPDAVGATTALGGTSASQRSIFGGTSVSSTLFSDGFEGDTSGWSVDQNAAPGPGLLTDWTVIDSETSELTWAGFHGENNTKMFYAGDIATALAGNSGLYYEDLANTDLISPVIDLTGASSAELSYWRAGMSAADYHFLRVWASPVGATPTWTKIDEMSGDFVNTGRIGDWEESKIDLASFVGSKIRLRFQFDSTRTVVGTFYPMPLVGWYIDDVVVTGSTGTPVTTLVPSFSALPSSGVGSLSTTLTYSALSNQGISGYELDFGDGSPVLTSTTAGSAAHTYGPGQWTATLKVTAGDSTTKTVSIPIDVAPLGEVQVRIGNGQWVDAGAADASDVNWSAVLSLTGVAAGPTTIQVRHFDANGYRTFTSIPVTVA